MSNGRIEESTTKMATKSYQWRAHPAQERPRAAIGASVVIFALGVVVFLSFGVWWAILAVVVLVLVLNRFFFASKFTMDSSGITAAYPFRTMHCRWADLRRFVHDSYGGYLSTRARRSWLDAYTGMHVLFGNDREEVMDRIREAMNEKGN